MYYSELLIKDTISLGYELIFHSLDHFLYDIFVYRNFPQFVPGPCETGMHPRKSCQSRRRIGWIRFRYPDLGDINIFNNYF